MLLQLLIQVCRDRFQLCFSSRVSIYGHRSFEIDYSDLRNLCATLICPVGLVVAKRIFCFYVTPGRGRSLSLISNTAMLRNYIVIALRLLVKNKIFSFINILGLSTGIACCILIALFIMDEYSYEKGFADRERIFRINTTWSREGESGTSGFTSPPIAMELAQNLPEIEAATRVVKIMNIEQHIVRYKENSFFEKNAVLVDSTFFDVFPYDLKAGNATTALDAPSSVVLSEKMAAKIFGDSDPLDELIIINSGTSADTFRVTGVIAKPKYSSFVDADFYMSMNSNGWGQWIISQTTWANNNLAGSFLKIHDPASMKAVESKMASMLDERAGEELRASGRQKFLSLENLDKIRLFSKAEGASSGGGNITYVYIVSTIGIFILLLACINFMNLTTAKSAQRAGEVGIRKSMGAYKGNLVSQFLGESMVIVFFAVLIAFVLVAVALPVFNETMQKQLSLNVSNLPFILGTTLAIALITALLAGSYPAFFLSSMRPTQVLKGKTLSSDGSQWLRKSLVVFQFVITITLISSIVIIQNQLNFIQSKSLGFDTEEVMMIPLRTQQAAAQYSSLKSAFAEIAGVENVSATTSLPSTPLFRDWMVYKKGWTNEMSLRHEILSVDEDYFKVLDIPMITGRDFIKEQDNLEGDTVSTTKVIVNEASLKALEIPLEDALGSSIFFEPGSDRYEFTIVGVVKDFHHFSLHQKIGPMLFMLPSSRNTFPYLAASANMASHDDIYKRMKGIWEQQVGDAPFETVFLNENIKTMYAAERRTSTLLTISTTIALLISCLGLYGLSVYVAERKTKEIGIRKVVGASVESIVAMLSREYILLILISFIISIPLGYYLMNKWLEGFAYKIDPGVTVFVISGLISFVIAWLTVSFESFRAASKNPVDTFKTN